MCCSSILTSDIWSCKLSSLPLHHEEQLCALGMRDCNPAAFCRWKQQHVPQQAPSVAISELLLDPEVGKCSTEACWKADLFRCRRWADRSRHWPAWLEEPHKPSECRQPSALSLSFYVPGFRPPFSCPLLQSGSATADTFYKDVTRHRAQCLETSYDHGLPWARCI